MAAFTGIAQNRIQGIYKLPSHVRNGSVDCHFVFEYQFQRYTLGTEIYMQVKIKITGTPTHSGGEYKYRYNGVEYNHNVLAREDGLEMNGFTDVLLKNADFTIYVQGESYQMTTRFEQAIGYKNLMKVSKNTDPSKFTLSIRAFENIYCTNTQTVERRIQSYNSLVKKRGDYKNYISKGDGAFNSKDWSTAKYNYQQAINLFPNEGYPKSQMEKLNSEINKSTSGTNTNNSINNSTHKSTASGSDNNGSSINSYSSSSSNSNSTASQSTTNYSKTNANQKAQEEFENKVLNNAPSNLNYKWDPNRSSADIATEGINNIGNLLGNIAEENRLERERREAERLQRLEEERQQRIIIENRKTALMSFKEGNLPMSLSNINGNTVYYFFISYDSSNLNSKYHTITISNVFPVTRYSDETWPSKTTVQKEISGLTSRREILIGWFDNKIEAEANRNKLINNFTSYNGWIKEIFYQGKTTDQSSFKEDFWETEGEKAPSKTETPEKKQSTEKSFWDE